MGLCLRLLWVLGRVVASVFCRLVLLWTVARRLSRHLLHLQTPDSLAALALGPRRLARCLQVILTM